MVPQFRDDLPAMEKISRHLCNGPAHLRGRGVLSCSATIPMRPAAHGIIGAVYDIPPAVTEFAVSAAQNTKMKQAVNDFRKVGYGGPCPPHGHGPHHYHFRLLALSIDHLQPMANASCRDIEREARKQAIAEAILVGWYER